MSAEGVARAVSKRGLATFNRQAAGQPYRDAAFLESAQLQGASTAELRVLPRAELEALPALKEERRGALPLGATEREAAKLLAPLADVTVLRLPHARGLLCGIEDGKERGEFNALASRLLRVPAWGAKCFQPCSSELAKWLSDEQIRAGGGHRGNFFQLQVPHPPAFKEGTCVKNVQE